MALPIAQIVKGTVATPRLIAEEIDHRADGMDACTLSYLHATRGQFPRGAQLGGDYAGMFVDSVRERIATYGVYQSDIQASGLRGATERRLTGYPKGPRESTDSWDEVQDMLYVINRAAYPRGSRVAWTGINGVFFVVNRDPQPTGRSGQIFTLGITAKGLVNGIPRRTKRDYDTTTITITGDRMRIALPRGWLNYIPGRAELSYPQVVDTWLTMTPPDTSGITTNQTPPNPPGIRAIDFTGVEVQRQWPWGWVYTVKGTQPFGPDIPLYEVQKTFTWKPFRVPTGQ